MRTYRGGSFAILFAAVAASAGCEFVDKARSRLGTTDTVATVTGSGLALGLQAPPALRPGDEGALRLALTNHTDSVVSAVRLELIVPGWAEALPPRIGERPVTMSALEDGSTLFAYRMDDTPLDPKQVQKVEQRIRVPASSIPSRGAAPWTRAVRARLVDAAGRPLAEVESELMLDSIAIPVDRSLAGADTAPSRDRLGPVELGMSAAAVKRTVSNARDTTWSQEGMQQRGLVYPVGNGTALAVLSGDAVVRIEVTNTSVRTAERLGVGSRMEELRAAYGSPCAEVAEGRVVVWFANAPGISFALDTRPQNPTQLRNQPDRIPAAARVTRWWLRRGVDTCAAN